jgi:hypothetical protein
VDSTRRTALVAGLFYLITLAASIPAVFLLAPVLNHVGYIVSSGADTRVLWGCFLDLVNALACIGTAVALSLGLWLVVKGFRPSSITAGTADPRAGPSG